MNHAAELFIDKNDIISESPVWHPQQQRLYWIDLFRLIIHGHDPATGESQHWQLPQTYRTLGCIAPCEDSRWIAGLDHNIVLIDLDSMAIDTIAKQGPYRFNDGKCDRFGRFYIGTSTDDIDTVGAQLYCFDNGKGLQTTVEQLKLSNGIGFTPDNRHLILNDSYHCCTFKFDYDAENGALSNRSVLYEYSQGLPDGGTIDSEGNFWSAVFDAGKVICLDTNSGKVLQEISLPVSRPTSVAFGGTDLSTLFITTCNHIEWSEEPTERPNGAVFAIECDVPGLPEGFYKHER